MLDELQLREMRNVDITQVDPSTLVDINDIYIDSSLSEVEIMQSFFEQVKNPYCFRCGDTPIKLLFLSEEKTLKQSLHDYFLSLK